MALFVRDDPLYPHLEELVQLHKEQYQILFLQPFPCWKRRDKQEKMLQCI